jgi:hypothetical protein
MISNAIGRCRYSPRRDSAKRHQPNRQLQRWRVDQAAQTQAYSDQFVSEVHIWFRMRRDSGEKSGILPVRLRNNHVAIFDVAVTMLAAAVRTTSQSALAPDDPP